MRRKKYIQTDRKIMANIEVELWNLEVELCCIQIERNATKSTTGNDIFCSHFYEKLSVNNVTIVKICSSLNIQFIIF